MKNLALDPLTGDILIRSFNLGLTRTPAEHLSQKIENKLKTISGEIFYNPDLGIPYFTRILKKQPNLREVNLFFKKAIQDIPEVDEILSFVVDYDGTTRTYEVDFVVRAGTETITGEVEI